MRLLKSLYDLRQTHLNRRGTIDEHLVEIGFKSFKSNLCVYSRSEGVIFVISTLHVGFIFLLGNDLKALGEIKQKMISQPGETLLKKEEKQRL